MMYILDGNNKKKSPKFQKLLRPPKLENKNMYTCIRMIFYCVVLGERRRRKPVRILSTKIKAIQDANNKSVVLDFISRTWGSLFSEHDTYPLL